MLPSERAACDGKHACNVRSVQKSIECALADYPIGSREQHDLRFGIWHGPLSPLQFFKPQKVPLFCAQTRRMSAANRIFVSGDMPAPSGKPMALMRTTRRPSGPGLLRVLSASRAAWIDFPVNSSPSTNTLIRLSAAQ